MKFIKHTFYYIVLIVVLTACGDSDLLDLDKLDGAKGWTPDIVGTIVYGEYTVWDLVEQSNDDLIYQEDNLVYIRYKKDGIRRLTLDSIIAIPEELAVIDVQLSLSFPPGFPVIVPGVDYNLGEDLLIEKKDKKSISFKDGELDWLKGAVLLGCDLPTLPFSYQWEVLFPNLKSATGDVVKLAKRVEAGESGGEILDLTDGIILDMAEDPNMLEYVLRLTILKDQTVDLGELAKEIECQFTLNGFVCHEIKGILKKSEPINIAPDEFDLGVSFWDRFEGGFVFADPRIKMKVENYGLAIPLDLDMDFTAYGEGKSLALQTAEGFRLHFEGWQGAGVVQEIEEYNKVNSNINELLSLPPKEKIEYTGKIYINPEETVVRGIGDGYLEMGLEVEIPLELSLKNISFIDTIDGVDISESDKIEKAKLTVVAENEMPFELSTGYLYLLDEEMQKIDSIVVDKFVDAPGVDESGNVIAIVKSEHEIVLSDTNIENLENTSVIVVSVKASTSNGGDIPTIFKADAGLKMRIVLSAKLNVTDF